MVEVLGGLFLASAVSGLVPLVNAELLVVGAAVAAPEIGLAWVTAACAGGQMVTKTVLFFLARLAPDRLPGRARSLMKRATEAVRARGGAAGSLVLVSATTGLPPFYGVSLASGALGMRLRHFLLYGTAGRVARFGVLAWAARSLGSAAAHPSELWAFALQALGAGR